MNYIDFTANAKKGFERLKKELIRKKLI